MTKRFSDIQPKKKGSTKRSSASSRGASATSVSEQKKELPTEIARETKPGFFVPASSVPEVRVPTPPPKEHLPMGKPRVRNSQEYFSSLVSHSVHRDRTIRRAKADISMKNDLLRPQSVGSETSDENSRERLNIPLPEQSGSRSRFASFSLFVVLPLAILAGIFYGMSYFAKAEVTITPRQEIVPVSGTFAASRVANGGGKLVFETMSISEEVSSEIPADIERTVTERASGTIVIYNTYSSAPQRLIKNTRFETKEGKIFRAKDSVVVPGTTIENGATVPGSVEAFVVADEPGESYNIGLSDFTIPGFKGDPRFAKFYARSKTEMTGGFSGRKKFPSDDAIAEVRVALRAQLVEKLERSVQAQKPAEYVLFATSTQITLAEEPHIVVDGSRAKITENGIISGVIFKRQDFSQYILSLSLPSFDGGEVDVPDLENLSLVFATGTESFDAGQLSFTLAGSIRAIWKVDTKGLSEAIAGKPKKDFNTTLSQFANIRRAEASISPFWLFDFPRDSARIFTKLIVE